MFLNYLIILFYFLDVNINNIDLNEKKKYP